MLVRKLYHNNFNEEHMNKKKRFSLLCVCILQRRHKINETEDHFQDGDLVNKIYKHCGEYYVKSADMGTKWKITLKELMENYPTSYEEFRKSEKFLEFARMPNHSDLLNYTDDEEEAEDDAEDDTEDDAEDDVED